MPNELAYYDDENGNRSYFADDTAREQIANFSSFLSFTHFVQVPYTTTMVDSLKTAFENGTIPVDLTGVTIGLITAGAGGNRAVFMAQNQSAPGTSQTRYAAIYFGAYTAPRFLQKQDGTAWTDVAL